MCCPITGQIVRKAATYTASCPSCLRRNSGNPRPRPKEGVSNPLASVAMFPKHKVWRTAFRPVAATSGSAMWENAPRLQFRRRGTAFSQLCRKKGRCVAAAPARRRSRRKSSVKDNPTAATRISPSSRSASGGAGTILPSRSRSSRDACAWCCRSACARKPRRIPSAACPRS